MDESDEDSDEQIVRQQTLNKEMKIHHTRGFHDGYDESAQLSANRALDHGYNLAYEQHFVLSTLRGVAFGLVSSKSAKTIKEETTESDSPTTSTDNSSTNSTTTTTTTTTTNKQTLDEQQIRLLESLLIRIDRLQRIIVSQLTDDEENELNDIKQDLIKICKDSRLEILAHYVSEIGFEFGAQKK